MTILCAYDGRKNTESALEYAIRHSLNYSEPLYILTIVSKEQMNPEDPDPTVREYMEAAQRRAASEGAEVQTIIQIGKPDELVLEVADLYKCDTIVLGKSNKSSWDKMILGSVSNSVVKNFNGTVILVGDDSDKTQ